MELSYSHFFIIVLALWLSPAFTLTAPQCSRSCRTHQHQLQKGNRTRLQRQRPSFDNPKEVLPQSASPSVLQKLVAGLAAVVSVGAVLLGIEDSTHQQVEPLFRTVADIPKVYFAEKRLLNGVVVKVIDGDTVRIRHLPKGASTSVDVDDFKGKLTDETIIIRFPAVDCPETAKAGQPGQPFALEAKKFTTRSMLGKKVVTKVLMKDRYSRLLGIVRFTDGQEKVRDISEELLKEGLAVVYRQGGAVYDNRKDQFMQLEDDARRKRKGLWSVEGGGELPSEYKKKMKSRERSGKREPLTRTRESRTLQTTR